MSIKAMVKESIGDIAKSDKKFLFNSKEAKVLWKKSDEAVRTTRMLSEIYDNVPEKLDTVVHVLTFYVLTGTAKEKKAVRNWLNK